MNFKVGDIVKCKDGSSMPSVLHSRLWNGAGKTKDPFKPVKILAIEGNLLGVVPLEPKYIWDDSELAKAACWLGTDADTFVFWINQKYASPEKVCSMCGAAITKTCPECGQRIS